MRKVGGIPVLSYIRSEQGLAPMSLHVLFSDVSHVLVGTMIQKGIS